MKYILAASILFLASGSAQASECLLPIPDGGDVEPTPPSLTGVITRVAPDHVLVRHTSSSKPQRVVISQDTELFTVYGGGFESRELRPGQHAIVWFKNCVAPRRGHPTAVVLQVCSLAAEPCLP
jgi:hypothetical protein